MPVIGFLHTADQHVSTFRALLAEIAPAVSDRHVVDGSLLDNARAGLPYTEDLRDRLDELAEADVIVCTCSTIGGEAERVDPSVLRVDRALAAAVVGYARVGVVTALESTRQPTGLLLAEQAAAACVTPTFIDAPCFDSWEHLETGDLSSYHRAIADHVLSITADVDVVMLAQASMAPAIELLGDLSVPVLASPRLGVLGALERLGEPNA
ncbi:hypothetical protein ACFVMC_30270 [Nocardia sp. NPDC127579]|uniref:hypothetical protein n=1 Tax=Nocardia sp. NPDC127579 TaxID=3345402 RepID=UPI003632D32E